MSTESGNDPIGDFQRWLMRAGARSIGRDVADRVKSTFTGDRGKQTADVWETATTEVLTDEPPECQWCPICRAARRYRDSGGSAATRSGQFAGVGDTLAGLTRDAFSLFESAMKTPPRPATKPTSWSASTNANAETDTGAAKTNPETNPQTNGETAAQADADTSAESDHGSVVVGPGVGWPTVVHTKHEDYEAAHEGGDRQESGEAGDGPADSDADQQVEGTAE